MNITVDIEIASPIESVWKAITNIKKAYKMVSAITNLKVLEEPDEEGSLVGLKWRETRKVFGKESDEVMWITEFEPLKYYVTRAENHGAIYKSTMSVEEVGENTLLTMSFEGTTDTVLKKVIAAVMGFFVKRTMVKMLEKDLQEIKQFVESRNDEITRN
jgi:carbon monoxide dehydrogenase subunit G